MGPEKAKHYVHSHKLCEESGFFRAAIKSGFKECSEQVIDLPEENAADVDDFIDWLYREKLPELSAEALKDLESHDSYPYEDVDRLCCQFIFADKYDVPRLEECVLQDLVKLANTCRAPSADMIARYYQETGQASTLRRLLCDWYTLRVGQKWFGDEVHQQRFSQNPEWAADLLAACARNWRVSWNEQLDTKLTADDYL